LDFSERRFPKALEGVDIAFVGVPFDFGTPWSSGTRKGPEFVRRWSQKPIWFKTFSSDLIPFEVCNVIDYGDLDLVFKESSQALDVLTEVYAKFRKANVSPITVGGEHTETYGILRGYIDPEDPVALIHFDAHTDTGGVGQGDPVNDGTLFTAAIIEGLIDPQQMVQIGIRNGISYAMANRSRELGITVYLIEDVEARGVAPIVEEIRKRIGDRPCYRSL
jgi:arginase family enzyme